MLTAIFVEEFQVIFKAAITFRIRKSSVRDIFVFIDKKISQIVPLHTVLFYTFKNSTDVFSFYFVGNQNVIGVIWKISVVFVANRFHSRSKNDFFFSVFYIFVIIIKNAPYNSGIKRARPAFPERFYRFIFTKASLYQKV